MLVASITAKTGFLESDQAVAMNDVLARVRSLPRVRAATASTGSPLLHVGFTSDIVVPGRAPVPNEQRKFSIDAVAPGYFDAIGAALVRGREFTDDDRLSPDARRRNLIDAVIINETLARRLWPNDDALGKQLRMDKSAIPSTVVGIARDMRDVSMIGAVPRAFFPIRQWFYPSFDVLIRVDGDPALAVPNIAAALDSSVVASRPTIRTMPSIIRDATQVSRVGSAALSICAGVALLLTSVGLYGLVAMWALRRRGEIGIRLALGGTASHVHGVLLASAGKIIGTGTIIGLVLAVGLVKIEQGWMGSIVALTPLGVVAALAAFVLIAGFATLLPSLRATRQSPADVLRSNS
jgi:ABC-type antimicrobial peptide transport system permease subunit